MGLQTIKSDSTWGKASADINNNFDTLGSEITKVKNATTNNKGYFDTSEELIAMFPSGTSNQIAYVGKSYPYFIWKWDGTKWYDTKQTGGEESLDLNSYYPKKEVDEKFTETDAKLSELGSKQSKSFRLVTGEEHTSTLDRLITDIKAGTQFSVYFTTSVSSIDDIIVFAKKKSDNKDVQLGGVGAGKYKTFVTDYDIAEIGVYISQSYVTSNGDFTFYLESGWVHNVDRISIKKVYDTISNKEFELGLLNLTERIIPTGDEARIHTFAAGYFGESQPIRVTIYDGKNIVSGTRVGIVYHDFNDAYKIQTADYDGNPVSFIAEIIDTYPLYLIAYGGDGNGTTKIKVEFSYLGMVWNNRRYVEELDIMPKVNLQNISLISDPDMIPTIDLDAKTLDLGPDPILKIGEKTYTKTGFASSHRSIPLQDDTGSTAQYLYFNTTNRTFYPKIYTYVPTSNEVVLGGVRHYKNGAIVGNFVFDYVLKISDVISAHNPAEMNLKFRQITRLSRYDNGELVGLKPLVLIQFSDIHSREDNLKRIITFANHYKTNQGFKIDDIVCGGDFVGGHWGDDFSFWDRCDAGKVLQCIGNHDTAYYTESEGFDWVRYVGVEAYNRYFAPYIEQWGVVQPTDAAIKGKCYYYKDYNNSNVRLVTLDCMSIQKDGDEEQIQWFESVLQDANEQGLAVVVVYHYTSIFNKIECGFTTLSTNVLPNDISGKLINVVDSYIRAGGTFACWITGHTHRDWFGTVVGTTGSKQAVLCIDTAAALQQSLFSDIERNAKDKSFDLFNVIGIDTYRHRISVFRVGADFDAAQRHIGSICYDYQQHKLLSNW